MCQLTLVKLKDKELIAPYLINQLLHNTETRNKDGAGIWSASAGLIKTDANFSEVHWSNFFSKNTSELVLAHVRAATLSKSGKREVSYDNSHPYLLNGLVFAHNGSLEIKDKYKPISVVKETDTDSLMFLKELLVYKHKEKLNFVDALKKTMENFTGKFAFLANENNITYVARGRTATLHRARILIDKDPVALVVNTDDADLKKALPLLIQLLASKYNHTCTVDIEAVPPETISVEENFDLKKIDTIKENYSTTAITPVTSTYNRSHYGYNRSLYDDDYYNDYQYQPADRSNEQSTKIFPIILQKALKPLLESNIDPKTFDNWSIACLGKPATTLNKIEIIMLCCFIQDFLKKVSDKDPLVADYVNNSEKATELIRKLAKRNSSTSKVHWPYELNSVVYLESKLVEGIANDTNK